MLPVRAWPEGEEGAGAAAALPVLAEEGSIPLAQLISRHRAAELLLARSACDLPRHAAVNLFQLFQCPMHRHRVSHLFICFFFSFFFSLFLSGRISVYGISFLC